MKTTRRDGQSSIDARDARESFARDELSERRETFKSLNLFSSGAGFTIGIHEKKDSVASSTRRRGCVFLEAALSSSDVVAASKNSAKERPKSDNFRPLWRFLTSNVVSPRASLTHGSFERTARAMNSRARSRRSDGREFDRGNAETTTSSSTRRFWRDSVRTVDRTRRRSPPKL